MNDLTIFESPEFGSIRTPRTVGKYLQFGGTATRPVLSRAQLARQIAELAKYSA